MPVTPIPRCLFICMALNTIEQLNKLIESKKNILVTFKKQYDGDAVGSALALKLFLEQLGKRVDIVCDGFVVSPQYSFLKRSKQILSQLGDLHQFIITIDTTKTGLSELSYDIKNEKLRIFITPKTGYITQEQMHTAQTEFRYDLIITLDTPDLISLGTVYANNENFFFSTPIINIDHKGSNEHYGQINVIDLPASTSAEIVFEMLCQMKEELITRHIANALLTGLIGGTNSFKNNKVRPQTLKTASKLVDLGADRSFIIKNLYQTKSISTFKLWGAALTNLKHDEAHGLVWTTITRDDFVRSGAKAEDLNMIVDELITTSPDAKYILLLHEHVSDGHDGLIEGTLRILPAHSATEFMKSYNAVGDEDLATFKIEGKKLHEVEEEIVAHIKKQIGK